MSFIYANKEELKFGDEVIKQLHIADTGPSASTL